LKPSHVGYLDPGAFDEERFNALLPALDARASRIYYSLISMLLAGIYFGLLVGHWLFTTSTWAGIAGWVLPVGLVGLYAIVTAHNMLRRLKRLHETRSVLHALVQTKPDAVADAS